MNLYPHQVEGVDWLVEHPRAMLADDQGLGKTATAIVAADRLRARKLLVIAPAVVTRNWQREIGAWSPARRVQVLARDGAAIEADTLVVSHGLVWRPQTIAALLRSMWDAIILDEAQFFRNPEAKRTRAVYSLSAGAPALSRRSPVMWALTGTPMPNHPGELWTAMRGILPSTLRHPKHKDRALTHGEFVGSFCVTRRDQFGASRPIAVNKRNLPVLKKRLEGFLLRRTKKQRLRLPELRFGVVSVTATIPPELAALESKLGLAGHDAEGVMNILRNHAPHIAQWRRLCGMAKVPAAVEILRDELDESTGKVIVFAHHTDVIADVAAGLRAHGVVTITGATTPRQRQEFVDQFQQDPLTRVFVGQITAAGVGITLTAASDVVMLEQSWTPGDNMQAIDRAHRIGQDKSVLVRTFALADSVDEIVSEALARKTAMIREVLEP